MDKNQSPPALFTALSALIALAAGIGIWYVFSQATATHSFVIIPVAAGVIAAMLLLMLKESTHAGHVTGSATAQTDVATRLPSHAVAYQLLQREFAAAERGGRDLTVVLFSLDNLPRLAATKGAGEANKILLSVGAIMKKRTRGMNMTTRLDGGYTFMSILGSVDEIGAARFAEKVTRDLGAVRLNGRPLEVRLGIYGYHPEMQSADDLVAQAYGSLTEVSIVDGGLRTA
jgi:diguanylate cyclase (GGDEF)-like protein